MNTSARTVLSLTSSEAIDFFMKSEQYHGFELPEYFVLMKFSVMSEAKLVALRTKIVFITILIPMIC